MTKKRNKIKQPAREATKRQLSRWQQQQRRQQIIRGIGIFIIATVLVLVGAGWYFGQYQPRHQTAIRVNDTQFNMDYYIKALEFYGQGQSTAYMYGVANEVVFLIERNELLRQEAAELGISVSDEEIDEEIKTHDPPFNDVHRDEARSRLLITKLRDEYFDRQVPRFAEQRHIMAMLLESESQVAEVTASLEAGEDFAGLAGELSLEGLSRTEGGDLGWYPRDILAEKLATSVPGDYAFGADTGVLSRPLPDEEIIKEVGYWLLEVLERREESGEARVQALLLGSEEQAQAVRARLEAGEDFATLAGELSQLADSEENGGDLGWVTPGMGSPAFEGFVFDSEVELARLSQPIRDGAAVTKGGYWLLKGLDKDDNRELSDDNRDLLKNKLLNEWLSALWDDPENEVDDSYLNDERKAWAVAEAAGS